MEEQAILDTIKQYLMEGKVAQLNQSIRMAADTGLDAGKILDAGLIAGMSIVGERFQRNEIYVPEVLLSARAMLSAIELLQPLLLKAGIKPKAKAALGTVQGDIHNIGKNLVGIMLRGAGIEVLDLGVDVSPERFVTIAGEGVNFICMSCLLTTSRPFMKTTIEAITEAGIRDRVKILVGGAVVTKKYAQLIGADGYASNAAGAVDEVNRLINLS